jgi:hypothetical protein
LASRIVATETTSPLSVRLLHERRQALEVERAEARGARGSSDPGIGLDRYRTPTDGVTCRESKVRPVVGLGERDRLRLLRAHRAEATLGKNRHPSPVIDGRRATISPFRA